MNNVGAVARVGVGVVGVLLDEVDVDMDDRAVVFDSW